jgi:hypothetical protein
VLVLSEAVLVVGFLGMNGFEYEYEDDDEYEMQDRF